MKKAILLMILEIIVAVTLLAQAPQMINYQGVARNAGGDILADQAISIMIRINAGSASGPPVYTETHDVTTNAFGLFTLKIGTGTVLGGVFENIDWGGDTYFMEVHLDENGGDNYSLMGTTQLISVPYSLYSERSGDGYWQKSGDDIHFSTGKVGIGTDSPLGGLHLDGGWGESNLVISANSNPRLTLSESSSSIEGFYFNIGTSEPLLNLWGQSGATQYGPLLSVNKYSNSIGIGEGLPLNTLDLSGRAVIGAGYSGNNTAPANGLLVEGNVGIGTTSPSSKLHAVGTTASGQLATSLYGVYGSHATSGAYGYLAGSNVGVFGYGSSLYGVWGSTLNGNAVYGSVSGTGYAGYFEGKSYFGGAMGIGTTAPVGMLEVSSNQENLLVLTDSDGSNTRPGIKFRNNYMHFISGDDGSDEYFGFYSTFSSTRTYDAKLSVYGKAAGSWGTYIGIKHDGTDGFINTDAGDIFLQPGGGDVVIEGNLKTTQKTGYLFIPPSGFVPKEEGYSYINHGTDIISYQNWAYFNAPVNLPQSAIIVNITAWFTDGSAYDATLKLMSRQPTASWSTMGTVTTYGSISTLLTLTDDTISDPIVDNLNKFYFMELTLQSLIDFLGARIEYTYTTIY